jgi:hypothetical protein
LSGSPKGYKNNQQYWRDADVANVGEGLDLKKEIDSKMRQLEAMGVPNRLKESSDGGSEK